MTSPSTLLLLGKKVPSVIELVGLLCIRTLLFFIYLFLVCLFVFFLVLLSSYNIGSWAIVQRRELTIVYSKWR